MKFETKVFLVRQKYYFDSGVGMTSLFIKILTVVGVASAIGGISPRLLFYVGVFYGMFCYLLGFLFVKYGWMTAALEVDNRLNLFQRQVREKLLKKRKV